MASLLDTGTTPATVPFARDLAGYGDRVALSTPAGEVSYRQLGGMVDAFAQRLGDRRRLVLLTGANTPDALVAYLAALAAGHPVLLAPGDHPRAVESLIATYDPDIVVGGGSDGWGIHERRPEPAHELHPELALLLSTSGSTGSAKLVRLSAGNLQANAEAIAQYLSIRDTDRAATTLPMHYCYGLSVINSHLVRGASLILTDRSVIEPEFWELFREHRGTSLAGVPYTFDLLDRVGFDTMRLPHLRYLTQAGGALAPERVRHYAELGRRHGWQLFVMYGQTEATARMAYLPPELAQSRPGCIGVPVPGGSFRLEPLPEWPEPDTGELVFSGPNVMLGYAQSPADLAAGRTMAELHTGDIARRTADGLYQIVGRRSRFAKVFGLRIDLQRVEAMLERHGLAACGVAEDGELVVAVERPEGAAAVAEPGGDPGGDSGRVRRLIAQECGLPVAAVRVGFLPALPRLSTGKPDYPAVRDWARAAPPEHTGPPSGPADPDRSDLRRLYADVLGVAEVTEESSFASLGGDSLSYVEMSVRLERMLGRLPDQWHELPIRELRRASRPAAERKWAASLDTSVALRAISIIIIVGTHAALFGIAGGAHLLMGVAGFNFARFHLTAARHRERIHHIGRSIRRVVVASACWIGLAWLVTGDYSLANVFLLNYVFGDPGGGDNGWHFWFIESLVYIQLAALLVLAVPLADRLERRWPFGLPFVLAGLALVTRYELIPGVELPTPVVIAWLFALGWAAAKATGRWQRLAVTLAVVATVPGFFGDLQREAVMIGGLVLLVWVPRIPSLRGLNRVAAVLAGSSLYIYLTHWQVYPHLYEISPILAVVASLAFGIGYAAVVTRMTARLAGPRWRGWMGRWLPTKEPTTREAHSTTR